MNADDKHPKPRMIGTTATDFSSPVYWDVRYQRQREADGADYTYEWYCDLDMGTPPCSVLVRTRLRE